MAHGSNVIELRAGRKFAKRNEMKHVHGTEWAEKFSK